MEDLDIDVKPDFVEEAEDSEDDSHEAGSEVDLTAETFPEVTKRFEAEPHNFLADPNYYKTTLANEGDIAKRVHGLLQKYFNATDPKDRSVFRPQIISSYWEFLRSVAAKSTGKLPDAKRFLLRFGILHPKLLNSEAKGFFTKLVIENELNQPIYYVDEWLRAIGTGAVSPSTTDEVQIANSNKQVKLRQLLEKAHGKLDGSRGMLKAKSQERIALEQALDNQIGIIKEHSTLDDFEGALACYTEPQKRAFVDAQEIIRNMLKTDRELSTLIKDYRQAEDDVEALRDKQDEDDEEGKVVDLQALNTEFDTVRQTVKMTVGRQGNHFPILTSEYFRSGPNDVAFRENIIGLLARIESIDKEVFCRYYRNRLNRIVPYVVMLPCYGDTGICWEPFDKHNRATSRGRIFIPMYPKNLYIALLCAVADLRWQVAKEKASFYWMEEGLTGNYYQWFVAQKLKGDVKDYFIQDYILWMTKEAEGIQKLEKEIRGAFWRFMPFSQEVKEKLKTRSFVYQELYQRDLNRAMSDGY
ncbi:MAG: hypothetical protein LBU85_06475 [Treponema sp.]|nr:hypothetical protein [Treponema sp.]